MRAMIEKAILLNAGQGSRLLPLTADRPKCLIEIGGRAIVDHQLDALASAGIARRVVVGGYRIDRLEAHLFARGDGTELRFNPFWSVASSISSIWAARDLLQGDFAILNGDTVYDPALIARGLAERAPGINLFVEPIAAAAEDDMLVEIEGGAVKAVAKTLDPARARYRSLGVIATQGDAGRYRAALDSVIQGEGGIQSFHHAIVSALARTDGVNAIVVERGDWVEIDTPEDIAAWRRAAP